MENERYLQEFVEIIKKIDINFFISINKCLEENNSQKLLQFLAGLDIYTKLKNIMFKDN